MQELDYLPLEVGVKGKLTKPVARQVAKMILLVAANSAPTTPIEFGISGYDEDPREIPEIPEARNYFLLLAAELNKLGFDNDRLIKATRDVLAACQAVKNGAVFRTVRTLEQNVRDVVPEIVEHRERMKRKIS